MNQSRHYWVAYHPDKLGCSHPVVLVGDCLHTVVCNHCRNKACRLQVVVLNRLESKVHPQTGVCRHSVCNCLERQVFRLLGRACNRLGRLVSLPHMGVCSCLRIEVHSPLGREVYRRNWMERQRLDREVGSRPRLVVC